MGIMHLEVQTAMKVVGMAVLEVKEEEDLVVQDQVVLVPTGESLFTGNEIINIKTKNRAIPIFCLPP